VAPAAPIAPTAPAPTAVRAGGTRVSRLPDKRQDRNPPTATTSSPHGQKEGPATRDREARLNTPLGRTPGSPLTAIPTTSTATRGTPAQHPLPDELPVRPGTSLADATSASAGAPEATTPNSQSVTPRPSRVGAYQGQEEQAPVSPSLRRFLEPLVGIDPDTVRVHRGDHAAHVAAAHNADAVALGDEIALGAGHDERDPSTAGLLAHELTHVARSRGSRFVPPIARGAWKATEHPVVHRPTAVRGIDDATAGEAVLPDDEESVARVAEARVRDAAARERAVSVSTFIESTVDRDQESSPAAEPSRPEPGRASRAAGRNRSAQSSGSWGSLPAPWEPLPSFLVQDREGSGSGTAEPNGSTASAAIAAPSTPVGPASPAPVVQRAERSGSGNGEQPARAPSHGAHDEGDGAPDVDALARQVYDVLRRRLAAERRRGA